MNRLNAVRLNDKGFTLVELLMTVLILGIIISAVGTALFVGLRTTNLTTRRLAEAHDAQLITSYFVTDVESSDSVTATALDARCTAGVTGAPVVSLGWIEAGVLKVASYATQTSSGGECPAGFSCNLMTRYFCINGVNTPNIVAHLLSRTSAVSIACTTAGAASGCTTTPDTVVISVTPVDATLYSAYTVAGVRKVTR
jgi:prepilin-type N-terminal cleavage/methylation domain-containing protein